MFYNSCEIDENLKCSFCKGEFEDVVKLIPDCGESICGDCYQELKDDVVKRGEFKCKACQEEHGIPKNGLPDNRSLSRMLKRRKIEKPLSEEAKDLKRRLESLASQLRELEAFEDRDYINEYFDQLDIEIIEEIESVVKVLNDIQENLLKQTRKYRQHCLNSLTTRAPIQSQTDEGKDVKKKLLELSKQIGEFYSHWNGLLNQPDSYASERDVNAALDIAREYEKKMSALNSKLQRDALNSQLMKFRSSHSFFSDPSPLTKLFSLFVHDVSKETRIEPVAAQTLTGHSDQVLQVLFVSDDKLASCSKDGTIKIWNVKDGALLYELRGHFSSVNSLALLNNGCLASGSQDSTILIWNLDTKKVVKMLTGHLGSVVCLKALKNGNLASYSLDDTIKIWNPFATCNNLLRTIKVHGNSKWLLSFGVLSNDNLVTISRDKDSKEECILRVWNHEDGQLVKAVPTGRKGAKALLVLCDDQLVLSFQSCTSIKIIDLTDNSKSHIQTRAHDSDIAMLAQLPDGNLMSIGEDNDQDSKVHYSIKTWNLPGLDLVRTIKTDHSAIINSIAFSPNGDLVATGSCDKTIKLWRLSSN